MFNPAAANVLVMAFLCLSKDHGVGGRGMSFAVSFAAHLPGLTRPTGTAGGGFSPHHGQLWGSVDPRG